MRVVDHREPASLRSRTTGVPQHKRRSSYQCIPVGALVLSFYLSAPPFLRAQAAHHSGVHGGSRCLWRADVLCTLTSRNIDRAFRVKHGHPAGAPRTGSSAVAMILILVISQACSVGVRSGSIPIPSSGKVEFVCFFDERLNQQDNTAAASSYCVL